MLLQRRFGLVAAAFASMFTVFGVAYSFGAFFNPMAKELGSGNGATAAVFAITAFLWFSLGAVTGPLADRIGPRRVVAAGAVFLSGGLFLTSLVHQIWLGYLTYGIGVGIGTACGYVPMVAAVGGWFERGRALAIGIAVSGIGVGTLVVPPLSALLISAPGWRTTYVVLAAGAAVLMLAAAAAAQRPPTSSEVVPSLGAAIRTRQFGLIYLGGVLVSFGLFFAFVHLVPYATRQGIAAVQAAWLIGVIGVGSAVARLGLAAVAERRGVLATYKLSVVILTVSFAVWLVAPGFAGLALFALLLGLGYGGWVALTPAVIAEIFGTRGMGGTVGVAYTAAAAGGLIGPVAGGYAVDLTGGYQVPITASLLLAAVGLGLVATLRGGSPVHSTKSSTPPRR